MIFDAYEGREEFVYICPQNVRIEDIAERFGVSVEKLLKDNQIDDVSAGDVILVRRKGILYRVCIQDTVQSISDKFAVSVSDIIKWSGGGIYPAQLLYIEK